MRNLIRRAIAVPGLALLATLGFASTAWAHAAISPPTAETGVLQQFTLAVPTEEEGATTTEIQLTVPDGVAIDSFEAAPGWTRTVKATGSGEDAVINQVTWTGGGGADRRGLGVPVPGRSHGRIEDLHLRRAPDLLGRHRGGVDGRLRTRIRPAPPSRVSRHWEGRPTRLRSWRWCWRRRGAARWDRTVLGETISDMSRWARAAVVVMVLAAAGAFPAAARLTPCWSSTTPVASATVPASPTRVTLTFDEAVEPRFAVISVTDAGGNQQVKGRPTPSRATPTRSRSTSATCLRAGTWCTGARSPPTATLCAARSHSPSGRFPERLRSS